MTRRILLALLAFTAAVLAGAVVPLTLSTIGQDRTSFVQATAGMVRSDAAVAQADLDGSPDEPLFSVVSQTARAGDGLLIVTSRLTADGGYQQVHALWNGGMPAVDWSQLADEADRQGWLATKVGQPVQAVTETTGSRVIAAMPVYARGTGPLVGTVILARSTRSLDSEILALWVIFGTICVVAMIGAALLAFGLARWVSRPLKGLDAAARRLADGDLAIRAKVGSGPPELRRLGTTFNTMAGRLEALVHGSRAVIADVSHQLRTPLAALRLRLDLLAADTTQADPDTGHELAGALDELARLSRLVDGLLAVARAENVVPVPVAVDVAEVAGERVAAWHPVADDRDIALVATSSADGGAGLAGARGVSRLAGGFSSPSGSGPVLAWIGEGHLEQILDNLIANALDALSPGHRVTLTTAATPSGARITVSDNGPGMSAEDRERAFLRFTSMSPGGTGLGLAIVHRLVTSNGGTASLAETPGGGLTVTLDFPGAPASNGSAPASTASASTASASTASASTAPASTAPASTAPASTAPASTAPGSAQAALSL
jgi:signal transduction histidine kinase